MFAAVNTGLDLTQAQTNMTFRLIENASKSHKMSFFRKLLQDQCDSTTGIKDLHTHKYQLYFSYNLH